MVSAGNLIRKLLFGLDYELAVMIVGGVMLAYVIFWRHDRDHRGSGIK